MTALTAVEICAGAGGQSLGLHRAGFGHELAVELDQSAADTLAFNLSKRLGEKARVAVGDVADPGVWDPTEFVGVDLLAGGVPCPPFSIAGKQLGSSDERDLFAWAVELVKTMQPKALLLENVRGLSMPRFSGYRQAVADRLSELGYWSEWRLLHASDFSVAQLRPRFILVAMPEEYARHFVWPEPTAPGVTVGSELLELISESGWKYAEAWAEKANDIAPTIVGGSKKHGGADLGPTRAKRAWAQLGVDGKGIADAPPQRRDPSFRTRLPRLTNRMVARIQGWERPGYEWEFLGKKTSVYRQIGNAFPAPVAEAVGASIAAAIRRESIALEPLEGVAHDELYRILRSAGGPVTEAALLAELGIGSSGDLARRLSILSNDFELESVLANGKSAYILGAFKAFTGQDGHARHAHFADKQLRQTVS